jgi:hypothetical protein
LTFELARFHRLLLPLSSAIRALPRPCPSLFKLILPFSSFCNFRIREIQRGGFYTGESNSLRCAPEWCVRAHQPRKMNLLTGSKQYTLRKRRYIPSHRPCGERWPYGAEMTEQAGNHDSGNCSGSTN